MGSGASQAAGHGVWGARTNGDASDFSLVSNNKEGPRNVSTDGGTESRNHSRSYKALASSLTSTNDEWDTTLQLTVAPSPRVVLGTESSAAYPREDNHHEYVNYGNNGVSRDAMVPVKVHNYQGRGGGRFKHGYPSQLSGGEDIVPLLIHVSDGEYACCYRIISLDGEVWRFYNDTVLYELDLLYIFSEGSQINVMDLTTLRERSDGRLEAHLVVHPGDTQNFIRGKVEHYEQEVKLRPISHAFMEASIRACEPFIQEEREKITELLLSKNIKRGVGSNTWHTTSEEVLRWCVERQLPFLDTEYPPTLLSLLGGTTIDDEKAQLRCGWCKPRHYLPTYLSPPQSTSRVPPTPYILRSAASPRTVGVSVMGGRPLMAALAALAEDPADVARLFRHPGGPSAAGEEHRCDATRVTLCKSGWWTPVIVDHYFPVLDMRLAGGKCVGDPAELWVSTVEKACAKLHGGYTHLARLDAITALGILTGYPTNRLDLVLHNPKLQYELFDKLRRFTELGFIVMFDRPNPILGNKNYQRLGLTSRDACTVLDMKLFKPLPTSKSSPHHEVVRRLVKLRNIFGNSNDWTGKWGVHDPAWEQHSAIAIACGHDKKAKDDGSMWMEWSDMIQYFRGCGVCFRHNSFYQYRVENRFEQGGIPGCVVKLEVTSRTFLLAVLDQIVQGGDYPESIVLHLSRRSVRKDGEERNRSSSRSRHNGDKHQKSDEKSEKSKKKSSRKQNGKLQEVVWSSTEDCDAPSARAVTFCASPQVSFIADLLPEYNPYYLIPRSASAAGPFVLSFFTSIPCTSEGSGHGSTSTKSGSTSINAEGVRARFVHLSPKTGIFGNNLKFEVTSETSVKCRYQVSSPLDSPLTFPKTYMGKSVK
ncbi:protein of unknown function DUF1935 [Trypanosoma melophagium]|uniref:protein of unknown function DUF1935 n=1 Tax=Trypanosoma melophagium TaxID=715481 RepID=UPI00351A2C9C|nr:protein of unknown function DUF1935 [Trypanosoma melophagium]